MNQTRPVASLAGVFLSVVVAGCLSAQPTSSPTAMPSPVASATAIATPSATPTAAPTPSATPKITPLPTPRSANLIISHFSTARILFDTYHLVLTTHGVGTSAAGPFDSISTFEGDQSGRDYSVRVRLSEPGLTYEYDVVVVNGMAYVRPARGDWREQPADDTFAPFNPFILATDDVTFVDAQLQDNGRFLYHLQIAADGRKAIQVLKKQKVAAEPIDVFVNDLGVPAAVTFSYSITGRLAGERFEGSYTFDYKFSRVDSWSIIIEPPAGF